MLAWRNGRRNGLKIRWGQPREGSSPFASTIKKVGDIMGKRPYYIINSFVDYDGYDSRVEYIGTNWKAARNRFFTVVELLKQEQFFDHGLTENDIQCSFRNNTDVPLQPHHSQWAYMDDQNEVYISVQLVCVNTNAFGNEAWERKYKNRYPNSKY